MQFYHVNIGSNAVMTTDNLAEAESIRDAYTSIGCNASIYAFWIE